MFNNHETRETSHGTLKTCIKHQASKIDKLINKFTNSPIHQLTFRRHLYICRESSTNQTFLCKTNPIHQVSNMTLILILQGHTKNMCLKALPKTKPNEPKTNPILAQNWLCFSQYWLCYLPIGLTASGV